MKKITGIDKYLIKRYSVMLRKDPGSFVFLPLADAYKRRGMSEIAIEICLKGINYHPEYMGGKALLGELYFMCERYDEAEKILKIVAQNINDNIFVRRLLVQIYMKKNMQDEAINTAEELMKISQHSKAYESLKEGVIKQIESCRKKSDKREEISKEEPTGDALTEENCSSVESIDNKINELDAVFGEEEIIDDEAAFEEIGRLFEEYNEEVDGSTSPVNKSEHEHIDIFKRMLSNIKLKERNDKDINN